MSDADLDALKADARLRMRGERALCDEPDAPLKLIANFPLELARRSPVAGYWPGGGEIERLSDVLAEQRLKVSLAPGTLEERGRVAALTRWRAP